MCGVQVIRLIHQLILLTLTFLFLIFETPSVATQSYTQTPVNIFGDGDPANGTEDSREQILGGRRRIVGMTDRRTSAGTVVCDGKTRGTAMVIDTHEYAPGFKGAVLASAAHVLFDLSRGKLFNRCEFHFLALSEHAGYRVRINLNHIRMGNFDPDLAPDNLEFGQGDWVFMYAPKVWRGYISNEMLQLREFSLADMESFRSLGGDVNLIAFDANSGRISISGDCMVVESGVGDLGGGQWPGQLLDDCDSGGGASGGGIVAGLGEKRYLIGIRNGSHWSEQKFPLNIHPNGPPDGSVWDSRSNTNFSRAIDAQIMQDLQEFITDLEQNDASF